MKKPKVTMTILKEDIGYSATAKVGEVFIGTQGDTFDELKEMVLDAINLAFKDLGFTYTIDEIQFKYDIESFFDFYKVINAKALSERIGMSQSLLAQYTNGIKKPSASQTKRIFQGVQQIGKELSEVKFLL
ncbi:MAG: helix-turn-helix transcriptional regulator [Bacteroidota bacterium]|nr:helix-turn-helix transcriptional regulator [Bacteroidota bacterium]